MNRQNRFQPYQSCGRGRGGGGGGGHDRHCQSCGIIIKGCAHQKPGVCFKCNAPLDGRQGWRADNWGRCPECDAWFHREHCYCQCGHANAEAIERRRMLQNAARQQERERQEREIRELREGLARSERQNMELQRQIDDRVEQEEMMRLADLDIDNDEEENIDADP